MACYPCTNDVVLYSGGPYSTGMQSNGQFAFACSTCTAQMHVNAQQSRAVQTLGMGVAKAVLSPGPSLSGSSGTQWSWRRS